MAPTSEFGIRSLTLSELSRYVPLACSVLSVRLRLSASPGESHGLGEGTPYELQLF